MIRINLLPEARRQVSSGGGGQVWGIVYLVSVLVWGVVLFLIYMNYSSVFDEQQAANRALQQQIEQAKGKSSDIGQVEAKLAKIKQMEEVVNGLQSARQGPVRVLMELSRVLSVGRGPTIDPDKLEELQRDNPLAGYNPGWDIRRLWIDSFTEEERSCQITGYGKTNEDVAEFLRRLTLSEIFDEVQLQETEFTKDKGSGLPVVNFEVSCKVRY